MMKKTEAKWSVLLAALIVGFIWMMPLAALAAEPKAGDIIDSSNVDQYTDYLPMFMVRYIKDGWGLEQP